MAYLIKSAQTTIHPDLSQVLERAIESKFEKPYNKQVVRSFRQMLSDVPASSHPFMLDSFCGTGHSTLALAKQYPNCFVIGFDQSEDRLRKAPEELKEQKNAYVMRAEATDLWRLFSEAGWHFEKHTLFYPNPWPKIGHLRRRVHGHPLFPLVLGLSKETELRVSWDIYAQEFAAAASFLDYDFEGPERFHPAATFSLFEKKYVETQTPLFRVKVRSLRHLKAAE